MKHVFIIDPRVFYDQLWRMDVLYKDIEEYFVSQADLDYAIEISQYRRDAINLIQKQVDTVEDGDTVRVYAIGGDEILFDCLNGIAKLPNMELAVMPYGNSSIFLRIFGEGTTELYHDLKSIVHAPVIPIDMINMKRLCALNACIVGFDSYVPIKMEKLNKKLGSDITSFFLLNKLIVFFGNLSAALDKRIIAQYYKIMIDNQDYSGNYCFMTISNGPYYSEGKIAVKGTMPNDGLLEITLLKSAGPLKTMRSMRKYSLGEKPSNCVILKAKKITLQSDDPIWIQADGEFMHDNNFTFELVPGSVQIAVADNITHTKS
jgi:diacylglycerol kinase family enzyme